MSEQLLDRPPAPARISATGQGSSDAAVRELLHLLWRHKWLIVSVTALMTLAAGITAWLLPRKYEATVVVSPVSDEYGSGHFGELGSMLPQIGGLASLAGLSAPGSSARAESIATLQSASLTQRFIQANELLPVLYASQWDADQKKWRTAQPKEVPTLWKASEFFRKQVRSIVENKKSGLLDVTVTWTDPRLAADWANDLVKMANDYLRSKAIRESERNIAYLNEQVAKSTVIEVRKVIYSVMESEVRKIMLANGTDEYAFRVVDKAIAPEIASSPRPVLWVGAGFFGGLFVSLIFVLARKAIDEVR